MAETIRESLRRRFPGLAKRADSNSQKAAIHLFCLECMGGERTDARTCATKDCFLWPYGPAGRRAKGEAAEAEGDGEGAEE